VITKYVYGLLEVDLGLQKLKVPKDGDEMESTFVFASPNIFMNTERLLILIHGSGVVRAGQWARSLIINDSIQTGTQIPNIRKAQELGYEILVLNTNDNIRFICKQPVEIKESASPEEHANYVWNNYVKQINPKHIAIIAHSYGGCVTLDLAVKHFSDFEDKVFAIALTDSVHNVRYQKVPSKVMKYLKKVAINWAAHNSPLDTPLKMPIKEDIPRVSAGHTKHEMTTWSSFESINKFIQERYDSLTDMENDGKIVQTDGHKSQCKHDSIQDSAAPWCVLNYITGSYNPGN
ncbi:hypothetical protein L9F63_008228, partial [Diploptera punctata]